MIDMHAYNRLDFKKIKDGRYICNIFNPIRVDKPPTLWRKKHPIIKPINNKTDNSIFNTVVCLAKDAT